MMRATLDRRTSLSVLATSLTFGAATWIATGRGAQPRLINSAATYVPPTTLGRATAGESVVHVVHRPKSWSMENSTSQAVLDQKVAELMMSSRDRLKRCLAIQVSDTNKTRYVPQLLLAVIQRFPTTARVAPCSDLS